MTPTVEFYFDVGSATAYLAWTQLPGLAAQTGAAIVYKPMLLGGVFQATSNRSPMEVPSKAHYMAADMKRFARRYQVPFTLNPHFPINTLTLMRIATGVQMRDESRLLAYVDAVHNAIWVDARDMNREALKAKT